MADATLVYDDDCGFCTDSAEFVAARSDLEIVGFSELDDDLRERLPADYEECSHLVTDDRVYSCGASIEQALVRSDVGRPARPVVERLDGVGPYESAREWGYRRIANNRPLVSRAVSAVRRVV
ncbi:DCC1-like thiol-disulfide oxidoreductase family protein [Halorientalis halophila]|uniref:DCC1-like thiol-disulfide oxidoreductase family protein n=1 Tax=Halorientalis halophila TaxID=3108499 RepID=UPI00300AD3EE